MHQNSPFSHPNSDCPICNHRSTIHPEEPEVSMCQIHHHAYKNFLLLYPKTSPAALIMRLRTPSSMLWFHILETVMLRFPMPEHKQERFLSDVRLDQTPSR